jgi:hypothetical protein
MSYYQRCERAKRFFFLLQGAWCCRRASQPIRLLKNVTVLGLLSCEKTDGHKERAKQNHQHDFAVGALISVMI